METTIAVVIPLHNGERTILNTLSSVLKQTRLPDNIYVVNDGSTDNGPEIVRSLGNPLITVIDTPNKGASHARNIGVKTSNADYIAFLDADDLWLPTKLEKQLEVFSNNPQAKVVYCGGQIVHGKDRNKVLYEMQPKHRGYIFREVAFQGSAITGSASSVAVAREVFERVGYFDESLSYSEDADMWARLSEYYEFDYVPDPVVKIVKNPGSVTRNRSYETNKARLIHHLQFREKIAKRFSDKDNIDNALLEIGFFVLLYPVMPLSLRLLFLDFKEKAPVLMTQVSKNFFSFAIRLYIIIFKHFRRKKLFQPIKRIKLFMRTGTFVFRRAQERHSPRISAK